MSPDYKIPLNTKVFIDFGSYTQSDLRGEPGITQEMLSANHTWGVVVGYDYEYYIVKVPLIDGSYAYRREWLAPEFLHIKRFKITKVRQEK